jgi:DNA-binding transcriptional LysR family regulator
MPTPDLNLLVTLDALLAEGSVAGAARRLRLSPSAMSRALARLQQATGDPLLVRAGRGLVPTPRASELRERAGGVLDEALAVLRPAERLDPARLARSFTIRAGEGFVETFGADLLARAGREAPGVRLCFLPKPDKDSSPLRDGRVDLETGVVGKTTGPEVRAQLLFRDNFVGAVRRGHPLSRGKITPARFAGGRHVLVSRRGLDRGPVDDALDGVGLTRDIAVTVGSLSAALTLARSSDLIASVPEIHSASLRSGMFSFPLPVPVPELAIAMLWHPRLDSDPAQRWLRRVLREVCAA